MRGIGIINDSRLANEKKYDVENRIKKMIFYYWLSRAVRKQIQSAISLLIVLYF